MTEFYVFKVKPDIKPLELEETLNRHGADRWKIAHMDMATGWVVMERAK